MIKIRKIKQLLVGASDDLDYGDLFENTPQISEFRTDTVSLVYMKLVSNQPEIKGFSKGTAKIDKKKIGGLIFSAVPQKHAGMASKIHILEASKQILLCYIFPAEPRKDRSPVNGSSSSSKASSASSPYGKLSDLDQSGTEDELQSSVNSMSSISSGFGSFMQSLGFSSFNNNSNNNNSNSSRPMTSLSSATPPPYASSIPSDFCGRQCSNGLKRTYSSPCRLSAEAFRRESRRNQLGLAVMFSGHADFTGLKSFILDNYLFIETHVMVAIRAIKQACYSIDEITEQFIHYLNITINSHRLSVSLWQSVNFGGLVGSRESKDRITDIICSLYDRYEREKSFLSTVVTALLSATSTWHATATTSPAPGSSPSRTPGLATQRIYETYGGNSPNFPVRIAFIAKEANVLEAFLALVSYFHRDTFVVEREDPARLYLKPDTGENLSLSELNCCCYGDSLLRAFTSAISSNTFYFLSPYGTSHHPGSSPLLDNRDSDPTLTSSSVSGEESYGGGGGGDLRLPRFSTAFVDTYLNRKLHKTIIPNRKHSPVVLDGYHPALPVVGVLSTEGIYDDSRSGFAAFHDSMELSNMVCTVSPRMIINNTITHDSKIHMRGRGRSIYDNINTSSYIRRILRNFVNLKKRTGNSKLCLIYLESELETLSYVKEAFLTFCKLEQSPPEQFLKVFSLDQTDKAMFQHYL